MPNDIVIKPRVSDPSNNPIIEFTGSSGGIAQIDVTPTGDMQISSSNSTVFVTPASYNAGISGSLTRLTDGTSYLVAGEGIVIVTGSSGQVTISSSAAAPNTGIQFNSNGSFAASSNFTFASNSVFLTGSLASGERNAAAGLNSHAEGLLVTASANYSHAEGNLSRTTGIYAHAEGGGTLAGGSVSHAEGIFTTASNSGAHSEGFRTTASGLYTHAEGEQTLAGTGQSSHSEGYGTLASGRWSHAEGYLASASQDYTHAEGFFTRATTVGAHSEGNRTLASGQSSHTEGLLTTASNSYSHAEGNLSRATGLYAHAEGESTLASGQSSHAEGANTTAQGSFSHAEGSLTSAQTTYSHTEGLLTTTRGSYSHAEGWGTITTATYSHTAGIFTIASGSGQNVVGKYNKRDNTDSLFVVGNGDGDANTNRSDIFLVNSGTVMIGSGSLTPDTFLYVGSDGTRDTAVFQVDAVISGTLKTNVIDETTKPMGQGGAALRYPRHIPIAINNYPGSNFPVTSTMSTVESVLGPPIYIEAGTLLPGDVISFFSTIKKDTGTGTNVGYRSRVEMSNTYNSTAGSIIAYKSGSYDGLVALTHRASLLVCSTGSSGILTGISDSTDSDNTPTFGAEIGRYARVQLDTTSDIYMQQTIQFDKVGGTGDVVLEYIAGYINDPVRTR